MGSFGDSGRPPARTAAAAAAGARGPARALRRRRLCVRAPHADREPDPERARARAAGCRSAHSSTWSRIRAAAWSASCSAWPTAIGATTRSARPRSARCSPPIARSPTQLGLGRSTAPRRRRATRPMPTIGRACAKLVKLLDAKPHQGAPLRPRRLPGARHHADLGARSTAGSACINLLTGNGLVADAADFLLAVVKERTDPRTLPGLEAMMPGSALTAAAAAPGAGDERRPQRDRRRRRRAGRLGAAEAARGRLVLRQRPRPRRQHRLDVRRHPPPRRRRRASCATRASASPTSTISRTRSRSAGSSTGCCARTARAPASRRSPRPSRRSRAGARRCGRAAPRQRRDRSRSSCPARWAARSSVRGKPVWLSYWSLLRGGLADIGWGAADVEVGDILDDFYGPLLEHLARTHRVEIFAYDWRRSVVDAATAPRRAPRSLAAGSRADRPAGPHRRPFDGRAGGARDDRRRRRRRAGLAPRHRAAGQPAADARHAEPRLARGGALADRLEPDRGQARPARLRARRRRDHRHRPALPRHGRAAAVRRPGALRAGRAVEAAARRDRREVAAGRRSACCVRPRPPGRC